MSYAPLMVFKTKAEAKAFIVGWLYSSTAHKDWRGLAAEKKRFAIFKEGDEFEVNYE